MDHVRRGAAGALAVVATLHEGHIHALECQITESPDAVDPTTDDEDLR